MPGHQINPILVELLSNKEKSEIPSLPTTSHLNSKYASQVRRNRNMISNPLPINEYMMKCKSCGSNGKYNIGLLVVDVNKEVGNPDLPFQMTGYFRCKHCNEAGNWKDSSDLYFLATSALLAQDEMKERCSFGTHMLYDGSVHKYATDAEEHLLSKINEYPEDAFAWNRLGNLYHKGGRPELAVAAFEKSVLVDPSQVESHYSLGDLLSEVGDFKSASYHFRKMAFNASDYKSIDAGTLRGIVSCGLLGAISNSVHSEEDNLFLPSPNDFGVTGKQNRDDVDRVFENLEVYGDDIFSCYPLAELYMGDRS